MTQKQEDLVPDEEGESSLDDLYLEAQLAQGAKNPKQKKVADPSMRNAIDAAAKKMRELYSLPENWETKRHIALIDKGTQTLIGVFQEHIHRTIPSTRKLTREHGIVCIDSTEVVEGYIGQELELRLKGISWEREVEVEVDLWMDDLMVGCPLVKMNVKSRLGALLRVDLKAPTQFASHTGNTIMQLPAGTNVLDQLSSDSRRLVRKMGGL